MQLSLQNIADRLKLSRATVSRALRHDPRIASATKIRVRRLAEELGYRPNALMSEIAASRWKNAKVSSGIVIAYIDCHYPPGSDKDPLVAPLAKYAQDLGYSLQPFRAGDFESPARLQAILLSRGITDIILHPSLGAEQTVELDWDRFVAIQLLPGLYRLPLHTVVMDHFRTVLLAWQKAVSLGYERIGVILWDHHMQHMDDILRLSAARSCQQDLFPELPRLDIMLDSADLSRRVPRLLDWFEANKPDVVIGFSDSYYHIFCRELRRRIPYISLHTTPGSRASGTCATMTNCAREALNLLHLCRRTSQWGFPEQRIDHVIEPTWYDGESLPTKVSTTRNTQSC